MAVALRNRARRKAVPEPTRSEIIPKNLLLAGPTGVGKTEIARRVAQMVDAPFYKVEATKFSEVGYMGRDVEGMVRDLVDTAINQEMQKARSEVQEKARQLADQQLLESLLGSDGWEHDFEEEERAQFYQDREERREELWQRLQQGELEDELVGIMVQDSGGGSMEVLSGSGMEDMSIQLKNMFPGQSRMAQKTLPLKDARRRLLDELYGDLVDQEEIARVAIHKVQEDGVIFLDEIDKVALPAGRSGGGGPDVSREGVQRDLLPLVEGTTVRTKFGTVDTQHILFVAAGAFHQVQITDLIPELLGRFPIRVRLRSLKEEDLLHILLDTKNSLLGQYQALLATEGVHLTIGEDAAQEMAAFAASANASSQGRGDLGARRLHAVVERVLEGLLYLAPEHCESEVHIDAEAVREALGLDVDSVLDEDESADS
jgi:ATP-dependent HslUV protease ATP-binding subunit HslU